MIVETANIKEADGVEKHQIVKLQLWHGAWYVYDNECTIYDIKGFDIVQGTRWMRDVKRQYQIDQDSNVM
jgi:hypothetical protein